MKFKKFIASIAAAAIAVSAMAVSASAAINITYPDYAESDEYGEYMDMAKMYADVSKVATCEITIKDTEGNGCVVVAAESTGWGWTPVDSSTANGDGTFTYSVPCSLAESDTFVKITIQDWDESTPAEVCKIVLKDASGSVLFEAPAGGAAAEPATLEATEADGPAVADTTTAPATGNAAVASIAAVMGLAGVAMIASRKRK